MTRFDVKQLTVVDMYGTSGTVRRRQIIRAEFIGGAIGCVALGVTSLLLGRSVAFCLVGGWLVGVGINYVPLAAYSVCLYPPGRLRAELAGVDIRAEQRYYTRAQIVLFMPLFIAVLAAAQEWSRRP